jgi:hypothetical protein
LRKKKWEIEVSERGHLFFLKFDVMEKKNDEKIIFETFLLCQNRTFLLSRVPYSCWLDHLIFLVFFSSGCVDKKKIYLFLILSHNGVSSDCNF